MLELYDYELSSDAYKARLLLSFLHVSYVTRNIEFFPARQHHSEEFLAISPRGELPVLRHDEKIVDDAQSVLTYIANHFDATGTWCPNRDNTSIGNMAMWLSMADALAKTAGAARLHDTFCYSHIEVQAARDGAHELLRILDEQLWFSERASGGWICPGDAPTIADIACFPDTMLAPEGGIDLEDYRAVQRWGTRLKMLPRWVPMPGIVAQ